MNNSKWIFATGHCVISLGLVVYMFFFPFQTTIVWLAAASLVWSAVLTALLLRSSFKSETRSAWTFLFVDLALSAALIVFPHWDDPLNGFRLIQALLLLYAVTYGVSYTVWFGLIGLAVFNIHFAYMNGNWFRFELFVNTLVVAFIVWFAGLATGYLNKLAYFDVLTQLPNRRMFRETLAKTIRVANRRSQPFALMLIDLNRFKPVNDTLGHDIGDKLLQTVAGRLSEQKLKGETVARLGGDEIVAILPQVAGPKEAEERAERMSEAIEQQMHIEGYVLHMSASIGIAMYGEEPNETSRSLMKKADTAMYNAKEAGARYHVFTPGMAAAEEDSPTVSASIAKAMEQGEFMLYYQPKFDVMTGEAIGTEALLRWHNPEQGFIPPDRFIPVAEETGQIIKLGEWVLLTACRQAKAWLDSGRPSQHIAVNVSPKQFRDPAFFDRLTRVLDETGLPPELLELEITEGIAMQRSDEVVRTLHRIEELGVKISIDDFGAGYSSLSYLTRFPIHTLKIDRSFIRDFLSSKEQETVVSIIIMLAKALGLKVIAEGVETMEQFQLLKKLQCDHAQGYLLQRPVPADVLERGWGVAVP